MKLSDTVQSLTTRSPSPALAAMTLPMTVQWEPRKTSKAVPALGRALVGGVERVVAGVVDGEGRGRGPVLQALQGEAGLSRTAVVAPRGGPAGRVGLGEVGHGRAPR